MKRSIILLSGLILFLTACSTKTKEPEANAVKDPLSENLDSTVNPAKDFYMYACGSWIKKNPIPASEKSYGMWTLVLDETLDRIKKISETASTANAEKGTAQQKIGDFYFTGMDSATIEKQGISPLQPELDRIAGIKDVKGLLDVIAYQQTFGAGGLFSLGISQDEKRSDVQSLHLYQGGIGLPDRDYYFNNDERTQNIRKEYVIHLTNVFKLMGDAEAIADKNAKTIMSIETNLAKASRKIEDLRDPYLNYNKMTLDGVHKLTPSIDWVAMLATMRIHNLDSVIVGQPEFYKEVERSLKTVSIDDWKTYLRWNLVNTFAGSLSSNFDKESFHFYGTVLSGTKERRPRWKRILRSEEDAMGDLLGELYVKEYVSPTVKTRYQELTDNIIQAYRERIQDLTWMSDSTKQKALVKLNSIITKVSYPDKWKDYSNLTIDRSSYCANVMRANIWQHDYYVNKLGKPVDRTEWDMTPQTWNAYYNPSNNEIVLPAAIFIIPGLPDSLADDAVIYGYGGASTIGHELTHGFDDQGRQFDEKGNLNNWWTKKDEEEFNARAKMIIKQFDDYVVLDSLHIRGEATQGENIADLGGVLLGYQAFKKTEQYKSGKKINGLTPDQRFFLGYALSWLGAQRDESVALAVMTDVHSPNFLRINGPLSNIPEFYQAFGVKEGDPMWRPDSLRVKIW